MLHILTFIFLSLNDNEPLITKEYIDNFNKNPNSTFKLRLNPKFSNLTIGDMRRSLFPIRKNKPKHGAEYFSYMVGADERSYRGIRTVITGYINPRRKLDSYNLNIYNNKYLCTTGATAATSAMSLSSSITHNEIINLSLQFVIDCDEFGDPCYDKGHFRIYDGFFYEVPLFDSWDQPDDMLRSPPASLNNEKCRDSCYPGHTSCSKVNVLYGNCYNPRGYINGQCPIFQLNHWKYMKSFLWEVGPITSQIIVDKNFFNYDGGVMTQEADGKFDQLGMLYVTIIGWGERSVKLNQPDDKWWYVIPHFGTDFGEKAGDLFPGENEQYRIDVLGYSDTDRRTGIMRIARRIDLFGIETNALGAIDNEFAPLPYRTPKPTR